MSAARRKLRSSFTTWRLTSAAMVCALFLPYIPSAAQNARGVHASALDWQRAEFVIRLTRFVNWPDSSFIDHTDPLKLCVLGENPADFATLLRRTIERAPIRNRPIQVLALRRMQTTDSCHFVYVRNGVQLETSYPAKFVHVVESLAALEHSGMLALIPEHTRDGETRLRFHGRRERMRGARPVLSAQLLKLVRFSAEPS